MANNIWLRLYTEITRDRKVRRLSPVYRWIWITILCIAKESPEQGRLMLSKQIPVTIDDIADESNTSTDDVEKAVEQFKEQFMIEELDGVLNIINWDKRQFVSDNATERWKKWKDTKTNTDTNVGGNVGCTLPETETETETETDIKDTMPAPYSKIKNLFNSICKSYPQIKDITEKRKPHLKSRWAQLGGIDQFEAAFKKLEESNFCKGNNDRGWKATFDWLIKNDTNIIKVIEGNYDNKEGRKNGKYNTVDGKSDDEFKKIDWSKFGG